MTDKALANKDHEWEREREDHEPERDRLYALPAEQGERSGIAQQWEDVASENSQVIVLADPGMGKSWLIRAETHRLAVAASGSLADPSVRVEDTLIPVPVRADVLATAPGRDLADATSCYLAAEGLLARRSVAAMQELVNGGGVVLLVDALDEIPRRAQGAGGRAPEKRLQDLFRQWAARCDGSVRCIFTSRLAGYSGPPLPGAREAELLPFTPQDARTALRAWNLPSQVAGRIVRWLGDPGVAGMARVPLLLALMCSLAADPQHGDSLPKTRAGIYEAVLWHFLSGTHRVDYRSPAGAVDPGERESLLRILSQVAFSFATTRQGWVDRMPYSELAGAIDAAGGSQTGSGRLGAEDLIRRCETAGVLVPGGNPRTGGQAYMFLHRSVAEYLTARYLRDLPPAQRMQAVAEHQWFDPDWAEVIPLLGGLLATTVPEPDAAKTLVMHFLTQRPDPLHRAFHMAIRILGEQPEPDRFLDPERGQELGERVKFLLEKEVTRTQLIRALTAADNWPRPLCEALLPLLEDNGDNSLVSAATRALIGHWTPAATKALLSMLSAYWASDVQSAAIDVLAGQQDPAIVQAMLPLLHGYDIRVQEAAVQVLARHQDPAASSALLRLLGDPDGFVQYEAARALAGHQDPAVTQALLRLLHDKHSRVRAAAAEALARRHDPAVTQALLPLLHSDDSEVQEAAARAMAGRHDPAVTKALLPLLHDNTHPVQAAAARALAGHQDPAVTQALLPLLQGYDSYMQTAVVRGLAGRQDPAMTQALLSLLHSDHSWVRDDAADALAKSNDPAITRALLRLLHDSASEVRTAAVRALIGLSEPWVLAWVAKQSNTLLRGTLPRDLLGLLREIGNQYVVIWDILDFFPIRAARRGALFELADHIADHEYLRLLPHERPRTLHRIGKLTRKATRLPGEPRFSNISNLRFLMRQRGHGYADDP
jgi:HEAT repeat protein